MKTRGFILAAVGVTTCLLVVYAFRCDQSRSNALRSLRENDIKKFSESLSHSSFSNWRRGTFKRTLAHELVLGGYAKDSGFFAAALDILIQKGGNLNIQDVYGKTALHYAYSSKVPKTSIDALIAHGADENTLDKNLRTPKYYESSE